MYMPKQTKKPGKGTSKETAINNLKKAWEKKRAANDISTCINKDLTSTNPEQVKDVHVQTSTSIVNGLGVHVNKLVHESNTSTLLKQSYGFKSLCDTYQNMLKLVYPYGLHASTSDHMSHMFASIMPSLQKMLTVNINMPAPHVPEHGEVIEVSTSKVSASGEGMGPPLGQDRREGK